MGAEKIPSQKANFEDAVALTGYGIFNIIILLASGGCLMVVIIETMSMMFITPSSQYDLQLDLTTKGILAAISFFGVVSSSHLWGFIADTRGRRNVLIISMLTSFITSLSSSIVPQAWLFILIRYINGFFVGGASAVVYAYVGEFHDKIYRPKVVSWIAAFVAFGNMIIPGLAWLILPLEFSYEIPVIEVIFRPWRLLMICYGFPSLLFGLWLLRLPESPKYLMAQGRSEEALEILKYVFAENTGKSKDEFPVSELIYDEVEEVKDSKKHGILSSMWSQTVPLFKRPLGLKTFMVCLLQFGAFACSSGFIMWYPEVLNHMARYSEIYSSENVSFCAAIHYHNEQENSKINLTSDPTSNPPTIETNVFITTLIIGCTFAVLYIVSGIIINIVGAKRLVITLLVVTTTCGIVAQNITGQRAAEALMGIFLTEAVCIGILNAIVVELFPTQLRAMALAISLMAGRLGAVTGSNVVGPLIYGLCDYTFYVFGLDHLIMVITLLLLPRPATSKKMIDPVV